MIAPASVPQVMTVESCHHSLSLPPSVGISQYRGDVGQDYGDDRRQPHQPRQRHFEIHRIGVGERRLRPDIVQQVRHAARDDHDDAHHEDPHEQLNLDRRIGYRNEDEGNQRHARDAVGFKPVGARSDGVAGVVAGAVCDDAGVAGVVFLDVEDDLHQVRPDVGNLGEDAAGDAQRRGAKRFTNGEPDETRTGVIARNEQQDAQHQQELDADEQHADAHAGAERNLVDRKRLAPEARERRARVGKRVDADTEPRDAVAAGDADEAEEEDDA